MKILIVSDTHRINDNYFEVLEKVKPIDMVIHCGDAEGSEYALSAACGCPFETVLGNNDFFTSLPKEREVMLGKYKVWVTHGHYYNVSMGIERLKEEAIARGVDIVMFGHTHKPLLEIEDDIVLLNPGSLTYPRQYERKPSFAIMEIDRKQEAHFTISYL